MALIGVGCLLSLLGPAIYGYDQDRHLARTVLLLGGDLGQLVRGVEASNDHSTLSGLFFGLMAPAMAISGRPEWLWTYLDLLILLGAIPMWWVARSVSNAKVAWIATALYVTSSGRIENSWLGIHSSLSLLFAALWHLALLRYLEKWNARSLIAALVLLAALLSLHLSYLPMAATGASLVLWGRLQEYERLRRYTRPGGATALLLAVVAAVTAAAAGRIVRGWDQDRLWLATRNLTAAVGEHVGFVTPLIRGATWPYEPGANALMYLGLPLLVLGLCTLWAPWSWLRSVGPADDAVRNRLRAWVLFAGLAQLAGAWVGVREWHLTPENTMRYRHVAALAPVFMVLVALGVAALGSLVARAVRQRMQPAVAAAAVLALLSGTHMTLLATGYRDHSWRAGGMAILPELQETVAATRSRWNYDEDWFRTSVFIEPDRSPMQAQPRWEYLVYWLFREAPPPAAAARLSPGLVLYLAESGSALERSVRATQVVVDTLRTRYHTAYLCRRSAESLVDAEPFFLTYGPRREGNHLLLEPPLMLTKKEVKTQQSAYLLIAANVELPGDAGQKLAEVVIEESRSGLVLGARLYGRDFLRDGMLQRIIGPHVQVRGRDGDSLRVALTSDSGGDARYLRGGAVLAGWTPADVEAVSIGFDAYIAPGNPWEGQRQRRIDRPGVRIW
ncbi:MAG: hypothetical protein ACRELT_02930 [Longimicrobiales bacterium]